MTRAKALRLDQPWKPSRNTPVYRVETACWWTLLSLLAGSLTVLVWTWMQHPVFPLG